MTYPMHITEDQERALHLEAERFYWESFAHKPLNVFDLGDWTLSFPGDITPERQEIPLRYAAYQIDINDLNTCPRYSDPDKIRELWNEDSQEIMWLLGRDRWSCHIHAEDFVLTTGSFSFGIATSRFQHIDGVTDIQDIEQLKQAIFSQAEARNKQFDFKPVTFDDCFTKEFNGKPWAIIQTERGTKSPEYTAALALDHRTAITASVTIGSAWFQDEELPSEVEEKFVASFWDLLSQVIISPSQPGIETGTTVRTAPGQAEPESNDDWGW